MQQTCFRILLLVNNDDVQKYLQARPINAGWSAYLQIWKLCHVSNTFDTFVE